MPKSEPALSLTAYLAISRLRPVTEKRLFGGQYVRAGDLLSTLAALYESCALVGRMFKDHVPRLAALLTFKPGNEAQWLPLLKELVDERLTRYELIYGEPPDSVAFLVLATDYAKLGLVVPHENVGSGDDLRRLGSAAQEKVDIKDKNVWLRAERTFVEGIGFGLLYPELTWDLVTRQHRPVDLEDGVWKRMRSAGVAIPKGWATDSPQRAETTALDLVKGYVQEFRPELAGTLEFLDHEGHRPRMSK